MGSVPGHRFASSQQLTPGTREFRAQRHLPILPGAGRYRTDREQSDLSNPCDGRVPAVARTTEQRVRDSLARLEASGDAWLATSGPAGPHLVPLSLAWDSASGELIFCNEQESVTARNIEVEPAARVGLGPTRDVLMIDGTARTTGLVQDDATSTAIFREKIGEDRMGPATRERRVDLHPSHTLPDASLARRGRDRGPNRDGQWDLEVGHVSDPPKHASSDFDPRQVRA